MQMQMTITCLKDLPSNSDQILDMFQGDGL